jgi:hypothetical protein
LFGVGFVLPMENATRGHTYAPVCGQTFVG